MWRQWRTAASRRLGPHGSSRLDGPMMESAGVGCNVLRSQDGGGILPCIDTEARTGHESVSSWLPLMIMIVTVFFVGSY